jgi:co-chaperonin GroES (HSP10)
MGKVTYNPIGDRVVVEIIKENETKSKSGKLFLPKTDSGLFMGRVLFVGCGLYTMSGAKIPMTTEVDDIVLLEGTGVEHKIDGKKYNIYRENDILSKIQIEE